MRTRHGAVAHGVVSQVRRGFEGLRRHVVLSLVLATGPAQAFTYSCDTPPSVLPRPGSELPTNGHVFVEWPQGETAARVALRVEGSEQELDVEVRHHSPPYRVAAWELRPLWVELIPRVPLPVGETVRLDVWHSFRDVHDPRVVTDHSLWDDDAPSWIVAPQSDDSPPTWAGDPVATGVVAEWGSVVVDTARWSRLEGGLGAFHVMMSAPVLDAHDVLLFARPTGADGPDWGYPLALQEDGRVDMVRPVGDPCRGRTHAVSTRASRISVRPVDIAGNEGPPRDLLLPPSTGMEVGSVVGDGRPRDRPEVASRRAALDVWIDGDGAVCVPRRRRGACLDADFTGLRGRSTRRLDPVVRDGPISAADDSALPPHLTDLDWEEPVVTQSMWQRQGGDGSEWIFGDSIVRVLPGHQDSVLFDLLRFGARVDDVYFGDGDDAWVLAGGRVAVIRDDVMTFVDVKPYVYDLEASSRGAWLATEVGLLHVDNDLVTHTFR